MLLQGKVALITGGTSGIGSATARLFAQNGARLGILGRDPEKLQDACDNLRRQGAEVEGLQADASDSEQMQRAVDKLWQRWQRLDVVFINAGVNGVWAPIDQIRPDEWDKTLDINLRGSYLAMHYCVPHMRKTGGSIVLTSSVNGTRMFSNSGATAYACSKAAQVALAKMTALELAQAKIRVNVVCPGFVESEIHDATERRGLENIRPTVEYPQGAVPLTGGGPGKAEQVAQVVLFLASELSSHVTGTELWVDGAQSLLQG